MDHRFEDVERALQDWRRGRPTKEIPEKLWEQAVALVRVHGLTATALRLRLNHARLRERCGRERAPRFVELAPSELPFAGESVVELERENGSRLRLVLRGASVAAVTAAAKELWSVMR